MVTLYAIGHSSKDVIIENVTDNLTVAINIKAIQIHCCFNFLCMKKWRGSL